MKEFEQKVKDVVKHAAGENELSDEALMQITAGVTADLASHFKKAGVPMSPGLPLSSSDAPMPESESD